MTRVLIYEDAIVQVYEVFDPSGKKVGLDAVSKLLPDPVCTLCGK